MNASVGLLVLMILGVDAKDKPSTERRPAGRLMSGDVVLLRGDRDGWTRVAKDEVVHTSDPLLALAGYKCELKLDSKVGLVLRGELPEARRLPLLESAVTLHHSTERDVDLTVQRGRIFLSNDKDKGSATARLRFLDRFWDLTLEEPGARAGFEVMPLVVPGDQTREEQPLVHVTLYILKGKAALKAGPQTFGDLSGPTGRSLVTWENREGKLGGPHAIDKPIPIWEVEMPIGIILRPYQTALEELAKDFDRPSAKVSAVLLDSAKSADARRRVLGMRGLAAINAVTPLLDLLADESKDGTDLRREAATHLRQSLQRGPDQAALLFDRKKKAGLLVERGYKPTEAETILDLLYPLPRDLATQKETFALFVQMLRHDKLALRELAHQHLAFLAPEQKIEFNPAGSAAERQRGYDAWKKLLDDGKLPPGKP